MNIALLSYEYPTAGNRGGIGTYIQTISPLLRDAGHTVVTFTSTDKAVAFWQDDNIYCIPSSGWVDFDNKLPEHFIPIHTQYHFDVVEGTDFQACGLSLKKALPHLPLVVKLHTPLYIIDHLLYVPLSFWDKLRFVLGGLKRLRFARVPGGVSQQHYQREFEIIKLADRISSPGISIKNLMISYGFEIGSNVDIVPLPLVSLSAGQTAPRPYISGNAHILFIGRMEIRKGVVDLADAIPMILQKHPGTKFTFVGKAANSPQKGVDMISFLKNRVAAIKHAVMFTGEVDHTKLASYLNTADICIFPSHYESFGIACCEAMFMGKAVIGSTNGGMSEIIENNISGLLVEPKSAKNIADKIELLIENNELRLKLGQGASKRIRENYGAGAIVPLQIDNYIKAIKAAQCR